MSTSVASPSTFDQSKTDTGYDFVFARQAILRGLTERLNALDMGLATFYGDLVGRGSKTVKITNVSGIGSAETMQTMASETDSVSYTGWDLDADTMSIARHALAKDMSYVEQSVNAGRPEAVDLDTLVAAVPDSWMRKLMELIAATGATFSQSVGTTNVAWTVANELALATAINTTEGATDFRNITVRHPEQIEQLKTALRAENAFLEVSGFERYQGIGQIGMGRPGGALNNFLGLDNYVSFRVTTDGNGDHVGFHYNEGKLGWVVANTAPVRPANPANAIFLPQFGTLIEYVGNSDQGKSGFVVYSAFGVGKLGDSVRDGRRIISDNA